MAVAPVPGRKSRLTVDDLARLVVWAGFRSYRAAEAVAIILAESGGRPGARHIVGSEGGRARGSVDRGLFQINSYYHREVSDSCAYDQYCNVRQGYRISSGGHNFDPWSTWNSGAYRQFYGDAVAAVHRVPGGGVTGLPGPPPPPVAQPQTLRDTIRAAIDAIPLIPSWLANILANVLEPPIRFAMDIASKGWHTLRTLIDQLGKYAGQLKRYADHLYDTAIRWAGAQVARAVNWARAEFARTVRWVHGVVADALRWVNVHVWAPLKRAIDGLLRWVRTTVIPWVRRIVDEVAHWARQAVGWLTGLIGKAWNWARDAVSNLIRWARTAVEWVAHFGATLAVFAVKAASWIAWMVRWPVTSLLDLWRIFATRDTRTIAGVVMGAVQSHAADLEGMVIRWFFGG